jgi:hypothetical protein
MSSDDSMRQGIAMFKHAGTGHVSGWRCARCALPQYRQQGRRMLRVQGLKQWVCAGRVTKKAPA